MNNKRLLKFLFVIPALAGLCVMASVSNFSNKTSHKNAWVDTEDEVAIDKTEHDFETILEADGEVSATFTLTNNTKASVLVTNVVPSCGCTSPTWTKEPIEPGKTGHVVATYDPKGRALGPFKKTVTIFTSGLPERIKVEIKGVTE
jgi:hypothetical protein